MVNDADGNPVVDPVSNEPIVSGGGTAVLYAGDQVTCHMCHYPHKTADFKAEDDFIHAGCLDCHARVGSDDLKGEDDDDDEVIPPPDEPELVGFQKEPWQRLCNDCHKNKRWNSEGHKKHKEKRVACTACHLQ